MNTLDKAIARDRGAVMVVMLVAVVMLISFAAIGMQMSKTHAIAEQEQYDAAMATELAESAAAQALANIKDGGLDQPKSGGGSTPTWVQFGTGWMYYDSYYDAATGVTVVEAWGRVAANHTAKEISSPPDRQTWASAGWRLEGIEITVQSSQYIPEAPLYFGNGGIERPEGGFDWSGGSDPTDPSTWGVVTSGRKSSWQNSSMPFEVSALDHDMDFMSTGAAPAVPASYPHDYGVWASQNAIGQRNIEAWFKNSAGSGHDPTDNVYPPPSSGYDMSDATSEDYAYPIDTKAPDVQTFAWSIWNEYNADPASNLLGAGSHSGTYGSLHNPEVTFVTGSLTVPAGSTFEGSGILVIRDDYDPNVDTNNQPRTRANLFVSGSFKWTGLVLVAGWAPTVQVNSGGDATIVGSFFGEDSVQSGGEVSLDSATIILRLEDQFKVHYSNALFQAGGPINKFLPLVTREIVGIRNL